MLTLTDHDIDALPYGLATDRLIAEAFGLEPAGITWEVLLPNNSSCFSSEYQPVARQWLADELARRPESLLAEAHIGERKHYPLFSQNVQAAFRLCPSHWFFRTEEFNVCVHSAVEVFKPEGDLLVSRVSAVNYRDTEGDRVRAIALARCHTALKALAALQRKGIEVKLPALD